MDEDDASRLETETHERVSSVCVLITVLCYRFQLF